jgi:hypothetical protein
VAQCMSASRQRDRIIPAKRHCQASLPGAQAVCPRRSLAFYRSSSR